MANINFDTVFNTLKGEVVKLATNTVHDYASQAKEAGLSLLSNMKDDLATWTEQVKNGEMSVAELQDLVKGQVTTVKLITLKQAGLAKIEFDKFKKALVEVITNTVSSVI